MTFLTDGADNPGKLGPCRSTKNVQLGVEVHRGGGHASLPLLRRNLGFLGQNTLKFNENPESDLIDDRAF